MSFRKISGAKLPLHFALSVIALTMVSITYFEWRGLYNLEHPTAEKISCIGCHSDKHTLEAMADKAGDKLYLVHSGQLTLAELNRLTGKQNDSAAPQAKNTLKMLSTER